MLAVVEVDFFDLSPLRIPALSRRMMVNIPRPRKMNKGIRIAHLETPQDLEISGSDPE